MSDDFYCDYVFGNKIQVQKVEETDSVLAFHHTKPDHELHIVIVPKEHVTRLVDVKEMDIIKEIFEIAQKIVVDKNLHEANYRIITNGGDFQDSQHLHFHLVSGNKL